MSEKTENDVKLPALQLPTDPVERAEYLRKFEEVLLDPSLSDEVKSLLKKMRDTVLPV